MSTSRRTRLLLALALGLAPLLLACEDSPLGSTGFTGELEDLPGVVEAESDVVELEPDVDQLRVSVVVAEDAEDDEVADVLRAVADEDASLDLSEPHQLDLVREGDEEHGLAWEHEPWEEPDELVRRWVVAQERMPDDVAWTADGYGQVVVDVGDDAVADDVTATAELVAADPELAALPRWSLEGGRPADEEGNFSADVRLSTDRGMTAEVIVWWRAATAAAELAPAVDYVHLGPLNSAGTTFAEPPPSGSMGLTLALRLPGVVPKEQLTPARWGDRVWPVLHATLDLLRDLPPGSVVGANNHYFKDADDRSYGNDNFFFLTDGEPVEPDELDRGWNQAAARYLAG